MPLATALPAPAASGYGSPLPLRPIRPDVGADCPAVRADHPRPERRHHDVAGQVIDVPDLLVQALSAMNPQRPNAVLAHVAIFLSGRSN